MRRILGVLAVSVAFTTSSQAQTFSSGYWEKSYPTSPKHSVTFTMTLKATDIKSAEGRIKSILLPFNSKLTDVNVSGGQKPAKSFSYLLTPDAGDKASSELVGLGELTVFNIQRHVRPGDFDEMQMKLKQLSKEMQVNALALKNMPIAKYFLENTLNRLKLSADSYDAAKDKAQLTISLIEEKEEVKK